MLRHANLLTAARCRTTIGPRLSRWATLGGGGRATARRPTAGLICSLSSDPVWNTLDCMPLVIPEGFASAIVRFSHPSTPVSPVTVTFGVELADVPDLEGAAG